MPIFSSPFSTHHDVIIIGGGHAGTEAALAAARLGMRTLLITHNLETLGQMSCNPSIGGIGKSHLVKEIDALGGAMGLAADFSGIQWRILNASKGPAVRATRAQVDRLLYKQAIRHYLEIQPNLQLLQQTIDDLIIENNRITGVITNLGIKIYARAIVLTVGTFLDGKIHIGLRHYTGGRAGDPASITLAHALKKLPLRIGRLKTGTPPRIAGNTIDYSRLIEQKGDEPTPLFSFMNKNNKKLIHTIDINTIGATGTIDSNNATIHQDIGTHADVNADHDAYFSSRPLQVSCHIARTNERTHDIIRNNLDQSPLYTGVIASTGPRYCPSIEDKIVRFADKTSHQIFIEPEGLTTNEIYPNGISTSLPFEIQWALVRSIVGFEHAELTRPGYAIEYDFFDPRDLKFSLETKNIAGLFFAGQINGTTGYEEAAAQGLIAGLNAACYVCDQEPWWPRHDQAYIGVMLKDLVIKGTQEPYRMFTSRAEYRLLLREDNADLRLTAIGRKLGLVDDRRWQLFNYKNEAIERESSRLQSIVIKPSCEAATIIADTILQKPLDREYRALDLLRRSDIGYDALMKINSIGPCPESQEVIEQIDIQMKYEGYIKRMLSEIERHCRYEETKLPSNLDYNSIRGLSNEVRQKLIAIKPTTIGQAALIPGITPAAISILLVYLKSKKH